jgi:cytoskeletal protein CcmA (bactofilin family)
MARDRVHPASSVGRSAALTIRPAPRRLPSVRGWGPRPKRRWPLLLGLLVLAVPAIAIAQEQVLGGKFRTGREVVVPQGEQVADDLYASAGTVTIDGSVDGDLVAAGGTVTVSGTVGGDVIVGAGTVDISGTVEGDVRAGSGQIDVDGSVGEDLVVAAGQLTIGPEGQVGGDLVFGTGQTTIAGTVDGNVLGSTGSYDRTGTIGGSEDVTVSERPREEEPSFADRLLRALGRFVSLLVVGSLLLWLLPRWIERPAESLRRRPLPSLGYGLLAAVAVVVAPFAILLAMIILALLFGLVGLGDIVALVVFTGITALFLLVYLVYVVVAFLAQLVVALTLGRLVVAGESWWRRWAALALGLVAVVLVTSLPAVGGWLSLLIAVLGVGAIWLAFGPSRRRRLPPPPPPPVPASA